MATGSSGQEPVDRSGGDAPAGGKWGAYELFGEMRASTDEEREAYARMLDRLSSPIEPGQSVFDMIGGDGDVDSPDPTDSR